MRRRDFLWSIGLGAASLPFLTRLVHAQNAPTRLLIISTPNNWIHQRYWEVAGSGNDRVIERLPALMNALDPFKNQLTVLGELRNRLYDRNAPKNTQGGHAGFGHMLTGQKNIPWDNITNENHYWGGGISVDQFIASKLGVQSLTCGIDVRGSNGGCRISYTGANQPVTPISNISTIHERVFGSGNMSEPGSTVDRKGIRRRHALALAAKRFDQIRNEVGSEQAMRLERHLDALNTLEKNESMSGGGGLNCNLNAPDGGGDYPTRIKRVMNVLGEGMACGGVRVATLQLGNTGGSESYSGGLNWSSEGIKYDQSQHVIAHDYDQKGGDSALVRREAIEKVYYKRLYELLDKLNSTPEGDGSVLDNSLILYTKPMARNHLNSPMPYLLAGRAGGKLRGGRYLRFKDASHNDMLASICNLMGVEVSEFGDSRYSDGPLNIG